MMVAMIALLFSTCTYFVAYQFLSGRKEETHLPTQVFDRNNLEGNVLYPGSTHKSWLALTNRYKGLEKRIRLPFDLRRKLIKAGSPMGVLEFLALELLSILLISVLAFILVGDKFPKHLVFLVSLLIGFLLPILWLNRTIKIRQLKMRRDLPNLIDLLHICVSGGLDFMLAVVRVIRDLRPCDLTQELAEVHRQTQMGAARREALKNFAWRVDMPEVYSFVRTLVQADRMGTSIGDALKIQSDELRTRRFQRGEAMALKAPLKLLFPLFAFILPVVMIIVAGPILLTFLRGNMGFSF
jgi:tight adherence protein C